MDRRESWSQVRDWPFQRRSVSFIMHSDGGTRAGRCSAAAYIVEAGILDGEKLCFKPIDLSGTYLDKPASSFTVESLALAGATLCLKKLLKQCVR